MYWYYTYLYSIHKLTNNANNVLICYNGGIIKKYDILKMKGEMKYESIS